MTNVNLKFVLVCLGLSMSNPMSPWIHQLLKTDVKTDDLTLGRELAKKHPDIASNLAEIEGLIRAREVLRQHLTKKRMEIVRAQVLYDNADGESRRINLDQDYAEIEAEASELCSKYEMASRVFLKSIAGHQKSASNTLTMDKDESDQENKRKVHVLTRLSLQLSLTMFIEDFRCR